MAKAKKGKKGGKAGARKGGKRGKKTPETEQERLMHLEMEQYKAEEKARKEEAAMRRRLEARAFIEETLSKVNRLKIQNQWRAYMRLSKVEELRKQLEILSQNHEREVDRSDAIIQLLDNDLDDAEEQYQTALRMHLQNIENLIELYDRKVRSVSTDFHEALREVEGQYGSECAEIAAIHSREKTEMVNILNLMETEFEEEEADAEHEFESQREEIKSKNSEEYNMLQLLLEHQIEEIFRHCENAHSSYLSKTEGQTAHFKVLTKNDQANSKTIDSQMRKLQKLQATLQQWKVKINSNARECEERNRALRQEKDVISRHFQALKARMNKFRNVQEVHIMEVLKTSCALHKMMLVVTQLQKRRLATLTLRTREAGRELEKKVDKAKAILKLHHLCRQFETQQEQIVPFYQSTSVSAEGEAGDAQEADRDEDDGKAEADSVPVQDENDIPSHATLNEFLKRFSKVKLDAVSATRERERLEAECAQLRDVLRQYLDGISVNEEVLSRENPLLIINNRASLNEATRRLRAAQPQRNTVVVEAQHVHYVQ